MGDFGFCVRPGSGIPVWFDDRTIPKLQAAIADLEVRLAGTVVAPEELNLRDPAYRAKFGLPWIPDAIVAMKNSDR
jgi:hypothetical protein